MAEPRFALSVTQPWATLLVLGIKQFETRSWHMAMGRRAIAIHASKRWLKGDREFAQRLYEQGTLPTRPEDLARGAIIGEVTLVGTFTTETAVEMGLISPLEMQLGDYTRGRYAWEFADPTSYVPPIPATGRLGLWPWAKPGPDIAPIREPHAIVPGAAEVAATGRGAEGVFEHSRETLSPENPCPTCGCDGPDGLLQRFATALLTSIGSGSDDSWLTRKELREWCKRWLDTNRGVA